MLSSAKGAEEMIEPLLKFKRKYRLTQRETQLLYIIVEKGYTNEQIAEVMKITSKTVANHVANLLDKTYSHTTRELLSKVINGLLEWICKHEKSDAAYEDARAGKQRADK